MKASPAKRLPELRELTRTLNLHTPPAHFTSSRTWLAYEDALTPLLTDGGSGPLGLYAGVPLCEEHCRFCMYFYGFADVRGHKAESCVAGIEHFARHLRSTFTSVPVSAAYIGGGTPTVLSPGQIERLLFAINRTFTFAEGAQRTFEMSPGTATTDKIAAIVMGGFDRVSFGVQSFDPAIVALTGRTYATGTDVTHLIKTCYRCGVADINIDLMVGLDGETVSSVADSVRMAMATGCTTVSVYRYRPAKTVEVRRRGGTDTYVADCAAKVAAAEEVATAEGWRCEGRLDGEHVRFNRGPDRWPATGLYETRFRPQLGNSLVGIGSGARSFHRDRRLVHCEHDPRKGYELLGRSVEVEECDGEARVAAALVNELFREWTVDVEAVERYAGAAPAEVFGEEIDYLVDSGVLSLDGNVITVVEQKREDWTYYEKLFYPPRWADDMRDSAPGRLRVR